MNNEQSITKLAISLIVGIIIVGCVLIPVVSDAQTTMGNPVTYNNLPGSGGQLFVTDDVSGSHHVVMSASDNTITYDDLVIWDGETNLISRGFVVVTNAIIVTNVGAYITVCYGSDQYQFNAGWGNSYDVTFEDGTATMIRTSSGGTQTTFTATYDWIGYWVSEGGNYINTSSTGRCYTNGLNDIIACGLYSSGENDTFYTVKDGTISVTEDFPASIELSNSTLVAGTTDINFSYLIVNVGDESFTPYVWAVPAEIHGHASSGTSYDLLGIIPLMVILGIVIAAAGSIYFKNEN